MQVQGCKMGVCHVLQQHLPGAGSPEAAPTLMCSSTGPGVSPHGTRDHFQHNHTLIRRYLPWVSEATAPPGSFYTR